ncbi:MAG: aspartate/glutamate racemase family protein [Sphaerochaeta sp.]|nr:aspartate/glutamate racemase family protein [Sphaerochaeta sp.]
MKQVALVHTVRPVLESFPTLLRQTVETELKMYNLLDEFLASNPAEIGYFSIANRNRLFNDIKSAELTGADIIVVTCSTLTPTVEMIRPFVSVPIVAIDDAMTEEAVRIAKKIKVVATAMSTLEPTIAKLNKEAQKIGAEITVDAEDNLPAYTAMRSTDMATHDRLVLKMIEEVKGYDAIVLAQASMAHLQEQAQAIAGVPVLASPTLCCLSVKRLLEEM